MENKKDGLIAGNQSESQEEGTQNGQEQLVSAQAEKKKSSNFLTSEESRQITKDNNLMMRALEKNKKRSVHEEEYITVMRDPGNIVEFENLHTYFFSDTGVVKAVGGVSFDIPEKSVVGVVGESGCGKSVTAMSLMQLVAGPRGQIVNGSIRFKSKKNDPEIGEVTEKVYDIAKMPPEKMNILRGSEIAMIFQEPMSSLNPVFTIGNQLDEVTLTHVKGSTKEYAKQKSVEMLNLVGIASPERVYKNYPHELSGGMRQRVMIAMALLCGPRLIVADEPTTALDVTIQAQILELLREIKTKLSGSIMLITHDLGIIAEMADYVVIMYAGRVIEKGTLCDIFDNPLHPYSIGLQRSKPSLNSDSKRLYNIKGQVPNPINMPSTCYFKDRCNMTDLCSHNCNVDYPPMYKVSDTHYVSCHLYAESAVTLPEEQNDAKKSDASKKKPVKREQKASKVK